MTSQAAEEANNHDTSLSPQKEPPSSLNAPLLVHQVTQHASPFISPRLFQFYQMLVKKKHYVFFGASVLTAIQPTRWALLYLLRQLVACVFRVIGTTIGVGFGLGFALYVTEALHSLHSNPEGPGGDNKNSTFDGTGDDGDSSLVRKRTTPLNTARNDRDAREVDDPDRDNSSYRSLMASAGYHVPKGILRGQILRNISPSTAALYDYTPRKKGTPVEEAIEKENKHGIYSFPSIVHGEGGEKGLATLQRNFTQLPLEVQAELGKFIDYLVRDYVTSWYCSVDDGVRYAPEVDRVKNIKERTMSIGGGGKSYSMEDNDLVQNRSATMVLSLTPSRSIPMLEIVYSSLVHTIGNLSMFAADNVNVADLVLSKLMHILKVNIRAYRELRKIAQQKGEVEKGGYKRSDKESKQTDGTQTSDKTPNLDGIESNKNGGNEENEHLDLPPPTDAVPSRDTTSTSSTSRSSSSTSTTTTSSKSTRHMRAPSEVAVVREFLLQGKLHRAITFGMDVPGLLFGDKNGTECTLPSSYEDSNIHQAECFDERHTQEEKILLQRLFGQNGRIMTECETDYHRLISHRLGRILFPRTDFTSPVMKAACVEMLAGCVLSPMFQCATPDYVNSWIIGALEDVEVKLDMHGQEEKESSENLEAFSNDEEEEEEGYETREQDYDDGKLLFSEGSTEKDFIGLVASTSDEELRILSSEVTSEGAYEDAISLENNSDDLVTAEQISDMVMTLLSMALIELQSHIDFEEARDTKKAGNDDDFFVDWNDPGCRMAGQNLVLIIEAILIHGKLNERRRKLKQPVIDESSGEGEMFPPLELGYMEESSLEIVFMKVTSDLDSFEARCRRQEQGQQDSSTQIESQYEADSEPLSRPSIQNASELTTLRSLIAAWLHTGSAYRTISLLFSSANTVLHPFYHTDALIRHSEITNDFLSQLNVLRDVEILVDTPAVDSVPPLNLYRKEANVGDLIQSNSMDRERPGGKTHLEVRDFNAMRDKNNPSRPQEKRHRIGLGGLKANLENNRKRLANVASSLVKESPLPSITTPLPVETPSHLQFRKNNAFASSLRQDRERRMKSFSELRRGRKTSYDMICRGRGSSEKHVKEHLELHGLAAFFFRNVNMLCIRSLLHNDRKNEMGGSSSSVLATEYLSRQRRYDVPEVDSNFLIRIKPRQLQVVRTHRDQQNIDHSYYQFAAFYDEPLLHPLSKGYRGARLRKKCYLRFYPTDRSASVSLLNDNRHSDHRKGVENSKSVLSLPPSSSPTLQLIRKFFVKFRKCFGEAWVPNST